MKKLIIALTVSTFALAGSLHASDTKPVAAADKGACCEKGAAADKATASSCCAGKSACSKSISKRVAMSPRGAELAMR